MKNQKSCEAQFPEWTPDDAVDISRRCHMCHGRVTEDEYCHGCKVHICGKCDAPLDERPFGYVHLPKMHMQAS